jgi:hypothetical protein
MRMFTLVAAILASVVMAAAALAQTPGDPKIGAMLKEIGVEGCKTDEDGDYSCATTTTDTRTHVVMVISKPMTVAGVERRKLLAVGYVSDGPLSASEASALLAENSSYNVGAWEIQPAGEKTVVIFASHIDVNATAAELAEAFAFVAVAADRKEAEQTGKDEY